MDRFCGVSPRTFGWLICLAGGALCVSGCANYSLRSPLLRQDSIAPAAAESSGKTETASAGADVAAMPVSPPSGGRSAATPVDPQDMPAVLAELEALGAIDTPTRDRLVADLKKTDPALWPQLLAYFKASLAYRHKYAPGEEPAQDVDSPPASDTPTAAKKSAAIAAQSNAEPALLPGLPSAKPLGAARAALGAGATPPADTAHSPEAGATPIVRDKVIADRAVQPAAYQTAASSAEESSPAASVATAAPGAAATVGDTSAGGGSPTSTAPVAGNSAAGAAPPAAASTSPSSVATPLPSAAAVAVAGSKPTSPAPATEIDPLDWHAHLKAAIRGMERETADPPSTTAAIGRHAGLRLLNLVDGDRDGALRPLAGVSATQQDFWSQQLFGLSTYLDAERTPDDARRAAAAAVHMRDANLKLGDMATLMVRNVAFATEVSSYGVYKKFDHYEFHSGQEVLLYAEVENFKSAATDQGFHTALRSSYQILDNRGARVDQKEFEVSEEHCQNPRRDYFIRYFVWMPKRIYGGTYTLQLTVEDTLSQKIGQASIEFTVADKE
ncbi:MAG TPA: hypothetical protein VHY91_05080 [Pirellulales bacterium]|nr:hypothetical protein [Pirellulales bacterium]